MYRGIKGTETYPYILLGDRDSEIPTVWMLRPQKVGKGNRNLTGYMKSQGKKTDDAIAASMTKQDKNQFLSIVSEVRTFCFADDSVPKESITDTDELKKVFEELDINSYNELMNASRDIFSLKESEKKESSSSSGVDLSASIPAGGDSIASSA